MLIYPSELAGKIEYDESGTLVPTCELTEEEQKIFDEFAEADKRESEERFNTSPEPCCYGRADGAERPAF